MATEEEEDEGIQYVDPILFYINFLEFPKI
jgi:hypothetical protein